MKKLYLIKEWSEAKAQVDNWRNAGEKVIFTNGCFDILHDGHRALLAFAREQSGKVIVGLNNDDSVKKLKGEGRPVNKENVRAEQLLKTKYVDAVVIFKEDTPQEIIELLKPDVLIKGDDYRFETTIGAPEVKASGGKVLFFKRLSGISTTGILNKTNKKIETNGK